MKSNKTKRRGGKGDRCTYTEGSSGDETQDGATNLKHRTHIKQGGGWWFWLWWWCVLLHCNLAYLDIANTQPRYLVHVVIITIHSYNRMPRSDNYNWRLLSWTLLVATPIRLQASVSLRQGPNIVSKKWALLLEGEDHWIALNFVVRYGRYQQANDLTICGIDYNQMCTYISYVYSKQPTGPGVVERVVLP